MRGFLAMEYYGLILNRSFAVLIRPEGLFGCKIRGVVSALEPHFFEQFQHLIDDPELLTGSAALKIRMAARGSFFIPHAEIARVEYSQTQKWGMGPIPHSGKLYVHQVSGRRRELILLGMLDGEAVRSAVLAGGPIAPGVS